MTADPWPGVHTLDEPEGEAVLIEIGQGWVGTPLPHANEVEPGQTI